MAAARQDDSTAMAVLGLVDTALARALADPGAEVAFEGRGGRAAQHIFLTILRRRATLDWLIDAARRGAVRPRVRRVLWWALAEALYLDGLPVPVVVDTAVGALKGRSRGEAAFANALLRRVLEPGRAAVLERVQRESPPWVRLDLGRPLHDRWAARFDTGTLADLAAVLLQPAPVTVRRCAGCGGVVPAGLEPLPALDWCAGASLYTCAEPAGFFASASWRQGGFYVQDASTVLAPALLAVRAGETVADLCCAPGGKALLLLESMGGGGRLVCMDRSLQRLRRAAENLSARPGVHLLAGDAAQPPLLPGCCDAVLLDVPCSNTGVVRRRPDVRWHFSLANLASLVDLQARILAGAAALVRPGGRLVYSTCSIEPEENGQQVERFLTANPGFALAAARQLLPAATHDGAYAACLVRQP